MTWKGEEGYTAKKTYSVTGYRTKYVNGTSQGEETVSVSGIEVSCTGDFTGNSSSIWPDDTNEEKYVKKAEATITATPSGGTSCTAIISLEQEIRDWNVSEK